jgi:hypothetical protein
VRGEETKRGDGRNVENVFTSIICLPSRRGEAEREEFLVARVVFDDTSRYGNVKESSSMPFKQTCGREKGWPTAARLSPHDDSRKQR